MAERVSPVRATVTSGQLRRRQPVLGGRREKPSRGSTRGRRNGTRRLGGRSGRRGRDDGRTAQRSLVFPGRADFKHRYRGVICARALRGRQPALANRPPLSAGRAVARPGSGGAVFSVSRPWAAWMGGLGDQPRLWSAPSRSRNQTLSPHSVGSTTVRTRCRPTGRSAVTQQRRRRNHFIDSRVTARCGRRMSARPGSSPVSGNISFARSDYTSRPNNERNSVG